jgi:heme-degrading monooxygenase HmoA
MSHIRIGVYAVTNGTAKEAADKAQEGMLNVFRGQPGFQAYGLAEAQDGKVISVSLWDSGDQAQRPTNWQPHGSARTWLTGFDWRAPR